MYEIEATDYGFRVRNSGQFGADAAEAFREEFLGKLAAEEQPFSILIDVRGMVPMSPEVLEIIASIRRAWHQMSIVRVAHVISSPILKGQTVQLNFDSRTEKYDRVIDASRYDDWEQRALNWIRHAIEPDEMNIRTMKIPIDQSRTQR